MHLEGAKPLRFLCVCSGISAPSYAWRNLPLEPIGYAEIDPYACAVLAARNGATRPRHMPDPADAPDDKERRRRAAAIAILDKIEWGTAVPNHGDFTKLGAEPWLVDVDVLVGGTPCQDFSLAGLRAGIDGARGNLTLAFIRLADAIDDLRSAAGRPPVIVLWENVPGVFSAGSSFGTFLGGLCGSASPLLPPGRKGRWTDAGVVAGPRRIAAYRTLDAQHFGLAQRRRRVFVLARRHPGAWVVADALLPIIDSLRGDPAPSRETRADAARRTERGPDLEGRPADPPKRRRPRRAGAGGGTEAGAGRSGPVRGVEAYGGNRQTGPLDVATARLAHGGPHGHIDFETETFVVDPLPFDTAQLTHPANRSNPRHGDPAPSIVARGAAHVAYAVMPTNSSTDYRAKETDVAQPVFARTPADGDQGGDLIVQPVAAPILAGTHGAGPRSTEIEALNVVVVPIAESGKRSSSSSMAARAGDGFGQPGDPMFTLGTDSRHAVAYPITHDAMRGAGEAKTPSTDAAGNVRLRDPGLGIGDAGDAAPTVIAAGPPAVAIAFTAKDHGQDAGEDIAPTLRAMGHDQSHANGGGQIAVAFSMRGRDGENMIEPEEGDIAPAIRTATGGSSAPFVAYALAPGTGSTGPASATETQIAAALTAEAEANRNGRGTHIVQAVNFELGLGPNGSLEGSDVAPPLTEPERNHTAIFGADVAGALTGAMGRRAGMPATDGKTDANYLVAGTILSGGKTAGSATNQDAENGLLVPHESAVRRLTCRECERLQGFPDDHTLVPWPTTARRDEQDMEETVLYLRAAGCGDNEARALADTPDGPRYRVLGNSMATNVIETLGGMIVWACAQ